MTEGFVIQVAPLPLLSPSGRFDEATTGKLEVFATS